MAGTVKIIRVEEGFFKKRILVEALTDCNRECDSLLGPRNFYMKKGERRIVKMSNRDLLFTSGEEVPFNKVCTSGLSNTAFQFHWHWA